MNSVGDFSVALKAETGKVNWSVQGGKIRGTRRVQEGQTSREVQFCPLTALCFARTGKVYSQGNAAEAARLIGIDATLANRVMRLADYPQTGPDAGLRLALLNATVL